MSGTTVRPLDAGDFDEIIRTGAEAFGPLPPGVPMPSVADFPRPGSHQWGAFDGDELLGRVMRREYHSWWGGVQVPTNGVAGVTVVAEHRGRGLLDPLFRVLLDAGREAGDVISTLYPTAPGIYRRFGYEIIGSYDAVEVPTSALGRVRPDPAITVRRATLADVPAVRNVYARWASAQNGPLTRTGPSFPANDENLLAAFTGVTVALDEAGEVVGYVSWERGAGFAGDATIEVEDLLAVDGRAYAALWAFLGSFSSVVGQVRIETSGHDPARLALPALPWRTVTIHPYMLRVDDVAGAFSALPLTGRAAFAVVGDLLGVMDGGYQIDGACTPAAVTDTMPVFAPRGLALYYAGVQTCATLRMAGLLTGPTDQDASLDRLVDRRPVHIRDYF